MLIVRAPKEIRLLVATNDDRLCWVQLFDLRQIRLEIVYVGSTELITSVHAVWGKGPLVVWISNTLVCAL